MLARTFRDIGAIVRERRRLLGWTQVELADRVGTRRQWVINLEAGRTATDTGLLLRTLDALGLHLEIVEQRPSTLDEVRRSTRRQRPS
jgi:transcriptional regulator with XRE-family HTH domain